MINISVFTELGNVSQEFDNIRMRFKLFHQFKFRQQLDRKSFFSDAEAFSATGFPINHRRITFQMNHNHIINCTII